MPLPTSQTQSLAEALPFEIERCKAIFRDLLHSEPSDENSIRAYKIHDSITRADAAIASGDVVAMLRSYQELQDHE